MKTVENGCSSGETQHAFQPSQWLYFRTFFGLIAAAGPVIAEELVALSVTNGGSLDTAFSATTHDYDVTLVDGSSSIDVTATTQNQSSTISNLTNGDTIEIIATAGNGRRPDTYTLTIVIPEWSRSNCANQVAPEGLTHSLTVFELANQFAGRNLTEDTIGWIVEFLHTLTDPSAADPESNAILSLTPPRDGGPDGHQLDPVDEDGNPL